MGNMAFIREKKLRAAFAAVQQDLDIHLDAINENTAEIYENRQMISDLHERICKLSDQVSELRLLVEQSPSRYPSRIELSLREQQVFMALYTAESGASYSDLSRSTCFPVSFLQDATYELVQKGIPIIKQRSEAGHIILSLDLEFKEEQSKRNIVGIDINLLQQANRGFQLSLID